MDAFTNSATYSCQFDNQLKLLTNQLQSIQLQNDESKANDVQVYPTWGRFCNGPHMSIDFQVGNPFVQDWIFQLPQKEELSMLEMTNADAQYMANVYTKFNDKRSQAPQGKNLSIAKIVSAYTY